MFGGCSPILRKLKTTPPVKELSFDLQIVEAGKLMGNCYKMQVFENLYHFFIFHKHGLLKSAQQATAPVSLHAFCSIISLLVPDFQALQVFEAVVPSFTECLPSLSTMSQQQVWNGLCPQLLRAGSESCTASATDLLFAAGGLQLLFIFTYYANKGKR